MASGIDTPRVVLDNSLLKTKEIVAAVEKLRQEQLEADRKANNVSAAHAEDKQRIKSMQTEQMQAKQAAEAAAADTILIRERLEKEERYHAKTKEAMNSAKEDVAAMKAQMDAMKVEMEAQRKAFVINVNWAARCTELKTKFDQSSNEYDLLLDVHVKAKSEMSTALREQEDFRMKQESTLLAYQFAQDEIARQLEDLSSRSSVSDDVAAKLEELEMFRVKAEEEAVKKKLGSQQALSVLQRSLAKGEEGIKTSSFSGWASVYKSEKLIRLQKDKVMKRTMNQIANEGLGLLAAVFKEWHAEGDRSKKASLHLAQEKLKNSNNDGMHAGRARAIAQMEKQFKGQDSQLTLSCFQGWALGQIARKKKDQNHKKASRMIGNSGKALCAEIFGCWNEETEKTRKKKSDKEGNMKQAGRMIANSDKALVVEVFQSWWEMIEDIRRSRKASEAGTAKAMRMMSNSANSLMNLCFDSWGKCCKDSKLKDAGNKKAMRMMSDGAQLIMIACWQGWSHAKANQKAKDSNTAKAVRMINASGEALVAACFQSWSGDIRKNREKNKKMRVLEKSFGAKEEGIKMVVMSGWQHYAQVQGRLKRAKEGSMNTAMKSINGDRDMLLCNLLLHWARSTSGGKTEKLHEKTREMEAQLAEAVERARVAVERDLVAAKKVVKGITEELEDMKAQEEEAIGLQESKQSRLDSANAVLEEYDSSLSNVKYEIEQSHKKARDIGEELSKVGIFLSTHSPRANENKKTSRSGSARGSRPNSGNKNAVEELPRIDGSNSRPLSGNGSKSARGVAGERTGSGRSAGRPPVAAPVKPDDNPEKRYMIDGSGPYTYNEVLSMYTQRGQEDANKQWGETTSEPPQAA